ncbi:MAG: excinuclease ABC subunit C [Candidatus Epulonipiscioides saccharophilum]|nr:MAG: excinuclease ABC subunit C [Epulopiscium sp. AS2M-Bin001]
MLNLPTNPGVYLMKNELDEVIYIGKAKNLKNRISQYFHKNANHGIKVKKMISNILSYEYIITNTEIEALILESNLIKKYSPKYNIRLKDDKHYPYIKISTKQAFPKIEVVRRVSKDNVQGRIRYFGPYTDVKSMWEMVEIIKETWNLRSCNKKLSKDVNKQRECLNFHIGLCSAPCIDNINRDEYKKIVDEVISFLEGNYEIVVNRLEKKMIEASEKMNFELATKIRDRLRVISKFKEEQIIDVVSNDNYDILAYESKKSNVETVIQIYFVRNGNIVDRKHFFILDDDDRGKLFRDFIVQFYSEARFIPKEIIVQIEPDEIKLLEEYLEEKRGSKVRIKVPQRGRKYNLMKLAHQNAELILFEKEVKIEQKEIKKKDTMIELKDLLGLERGIERIEAFDISHTGGTNTVGAMVVFEDGKAKKEEYRKFKIKTVVGTNDYASMKEVISRRYKNREELPSLILVDGGKIQVEVAEEILKEYNLNIPVCGMVKDDKHKTNGLIYNNREIALKKETDIYKSATRCDMKSIA